MAEAVLRDVLRHLRRIWAAKACGDLTDGQLLDRFQHDRDDAAFTVLMQRHGPMVLSVCQRVAGDEHAAEDCFQGTFLVLARRAGSIRKKESVASWLYGVAEQIAVRAKTKTTLRRDRERRSMDMPPSQPLDELTWQELRAVLDHEISRLPEKYRAPIVLCYFEGKSHDKAAKELGWPKNSVTNRLGRGRELLRKQLVQRGITLSVGVLATALTEKVAAASVTARLTLNTVQAAMSVTAGKAVAAGVLSAKALTLAEEAMSGIIGFKMKVVAVALMLGLAVGGAGLAGYGALTPGGEANPRKGDKPSVLRPTETALVQQGKQPDKVSSQKKEMRGVDLYGDPLPEGAAMRLGTVQLRASGATLFISPDGKTLIGNRRGKYVSYWDIETGKLKETKIIEGAGAWARMTADGKYLMTSHAPSPYLIFEVPSGKLVHEIEGGLQGAAFSPDGKLLAGGQTSKDGDFRLQVKELSTNRVVFDQVIELGKKISPRWTCFTPDGTKLLVAFTSNEEGFQCWDIATGRRLWQVKEIVNDALYGDPYIFTSNNTITWRDRTLDLATGERVKLANKPAMEFGRHFATTPDFRTFLIGDAEGVHVWDRETGKESLVLKGASEAMIAAPDSKSVITYSGVLQRWDLATGKPHYSDNSDHGHFHEVTEMVFTADGKRIVSGGSDGTVRLWDMATGKPIFVWRGHEAYRPFSVITGVQALDMTPDGHWIISAGSEGRLRVWDGLTGMEGFAAANPGPPNGRRSPAIYHVAISPDGSKAVAGVTSNPIDKSTEVPTAPANSIVTWDLIKGAVLSQTPLRGIGFDSVFSIDRKLYVSPTPGKSRVIDFASGREISRLEIDRVFAKAPVEFSRDNSLIASASELQIEEKKHYFVVTTQGCQIWETATGKSIAEFPIKQYRGQIRIHPSGRLLAASNSEGIQIWDICTSKLVSSLKLVERFATLKDPNAHTSIIAFTPDGKHLATAQRDGTILIWKLDLPAPNASRLNASELDSLWTELKDNDAAKAWQAVWRLVDAPENAVPFLAKQLKPFQPAAAEVTAPLLADLASDTFPKREAANKRLKELGLSAESALKEHLKSNHALEVRQRIDLLLKSLAESPPALTQEDLRDLRGVAVLARILSPQATEILEGLAKGVESAPLTVAAKTALAI